MKNQRQAYLTRRSIEQCQPKDSQTYRIVSHPDVKILKTKHYPFNFVHQPMHKHGKSSLATKDKKNENRKHLKIINEKNANLLKVCQNSWYCFLSK